MGELQSSRIRIVSCLARERKSVSVRAVVTKKNQPRAGDNKGWCERGDSNPHGFPRQILSLVRLPIPPLSHELSCRSQINSGDHSLDSKLCRLQRRILGKVGTERPPF